MIFDALPDKTVVTPFNNDQYCGLLVRWAETGTGFGEVTISCNKATGEWHVDTEEMGPTWVGQMLMRLAVERRCEVCGEVVVGEHSCAGGTP